MDEFGSLVGAVIGVVGFIVEQQVVYIGVVVLEYTYTKTNPRRAECP